MTDSVPRNELQVIDLKEEIIAQEEHIMLLTGKIYMLNETLKKQKKDRKDVEGSLRGSVEKQTKHVFDQEKKLGDLEKAAD